MASKYDQKNNKDLDNINEYVKKNYKKLSQSSLTSLNLINNNKNFNNKKFLLYKNILKLVPIENFFNKYNKKYKIIYYNILLKYFKQFKTNINYSTLKKYSPPQIILPSSLYNNQVKSNFNSLDIFWDEIYDKVQDIIINNLILSSINQVLLEELFPETKDFLTDDDIIEVTQDQFDANDKIIVENYNSNTNEEEEKKEEFLNQVLLENIDTNLELNQNNETYSEEFNLEFSNHNFPKSNLSNEDHLEAINLIQSLYKFLKNWTNSDSATAIRWIPSLQNHTEQIVGVSILLKVLGNLPNYSFQKPNEEISSTTDKYICPCGLLCSEDYCFSDHISEKSLKDVVEWAISNCIEDNNKLSLQSAVKMSLVLAESLQKEHFEINILNRKTRDRERYERELMATEEQLTYSIIFHEKREARKRQLMEEEDAKRIQQQREWEKQFLIIKSILVLGKEQMRANRERLEEIWRTKERERISKEKLQQRLINDINKEIELMKLEDYHSKQSSKNNNEISDIEINNFKFRNLQLKKLNYLNIRDDSISSWLKLCENSSSETVIEKIPRHIWHKATHFETLNLYIEEYKSIFLESKTFILNNFPSDSSYFLEWIELNISNLFNSALSSNLIYLYYKDPSKFNEKEKLSINLLLKVWNLLLHQNLFSIQRIWNYLLKFRNWRKNEDYLTNNELKTIPHDLDSINNNYNANKMPFFNDFNPLLKDYIKLYLYSKDLTKKGRELNNLYYYFFLFIQSLGLYKTYPSLPDSKAILKFKKKNNLDYGNLNVVRDDKLYISISEPYEDNLKLPLISEFNPIQLINSLRPNTFQFSIPVVLFDSKINLSALETSLKSYYSIRFSRVIWYFKFFQFKSWEKIRIEKVHKIKNNIYEFKRLMKILYEIRLELFKGTIPLRSQRKKLLIQEENIVNELYKLRKDMITIANSIFDGTYYYVVLFLQLFYHTDSPVNKNSCTDPSEDYYSVTSNKGYSKFNIVNILPLDPEIIQPKNPREKRITAVSSIKVSKADQNRFTRKSGVFSVLYDDLVLNPATSVKNNNTSLEKKQENLFKKNLPIPRTFKSSYINDLPTSSTTNSSTNDISLSHTNSASDNIQSTFTNSKIAKNNNLVSRIETYWLDSLNLPGLSEVFSDDLLDLPTPPNHPNFHTGISEFNSTKDAMFHSLKSKPENRLQKENGSFFDSKNTTKNPTQFTKVIPTLRLDSKLETFNINGSYIDNATPRSSRQNPNDSSKGINKQSEGLNPTVTVSAAQLTKPKSKILLPFSELNHLNYNFINWVNEIIQWEKEIVRWIDSKQKNWKKNNKNFIISKLLPSVYNFQSFIYSSSLTINELFMKTSASDLLELYFLIPDIMIESNSSMVHINSSDLYEDDRFSPTLLMRYFLIEEINSILFNNIKLEDKNFIFYNLIKNNFSSISLFLSSLKFDDNLLFLFPGLKYSDMFSYMLSTWHGGNLYGSMNYIEEKFISEKNYSNIIEYHEDIKEIINTILEKDNNYKIPPTNLSDLNFFHNITNNYYNIAYNNKFKDPINFPFQISNISFPFYTPSFLLKIISNEYKVLSEKSLSVSSSITLYTLESSFYNKMQNKITFKTRFPLENAVIPHNILTYTLINKNLDNPKALDQILIQNISNQLDKFNNIKYKIKKNAIVFSFEVNSQPINSSSSLDLISPNLNNNVEKLRNLLPIQYNKVYIQTMLDNLPFNLYKNVFFHTKKIISYKLRLQHQKYLDQEFSLSSLKKFINNIIFSIKSRITEQQQQLQLQQTNRNNISFPSSPVGNISILTSSSNQNDIQINENSSVFIPKSRNPEEISYHLLHKSTLSLFNLIILFFDPIFLAYDQDNLMNKIMKKISNVSSPFENLLKENAVESLPLSFNNSIYYINESSAIFNKINRKKIDFQVSNSEISQQGALSSVSFDEIEEEKISNNIKSMLICLPLDHMESLRCICANETANNLKSQSRLSSNLIHNIILEEDEEEDDIDNDQLKFKKDDDFLYDIIKINELKLNNYKSYHPRLELIYSSSKKNFLSINKIQDSLNNYWKRFSPWLYISDNSSTNSIFNSNSLVLSNNEFELYSNGSIKLKHLDYFIITTRDWLQFLETLRSVKEIKNVQKFHFKNKSKTKTSSTSVSSLSLPTSSSNLSLIHFTYLLQDINVKYHYPLIILKLFYDRIIYTYKVLTFSSFINKNELMIQNYAVNFYVQLKFKTYLLPIIRWSLNTYQMNYFLLNICNLIQRNDLIINVIKLCKHYNITENEIQMYYNSNDFFYLDKKECKSIQYSSSIFNERIHFVDINKKKNNVNKELKTEDSLNNSEKNKVIDHYIVIIIVFVRKLINFINKYKLENPSEDLPNPLSLSTPNFSTKLDSKLNDFENMFYELLVILIELKEFQYQIELEYHDKYNKITENIDVNTLFCLKEEEELLKQNNKSNESIFSFLFSCLPFLKPSKIHTTDEIHPKSNYLDQILEATNNSYLDKDYYNCFDISNQPQEDIEKSFNSYKSLINFKDLYISPDKNKNIWYDLKKKRLKKLKLEAISLLNHMLKDHSRTPAQCPRFINLMKNNLSISFQEWNIFEKNFNIALTEKKTDSLPDLASMPNHFTSMKKFLFRSNRNKEKNKKEDENNLPERATKGDPMVNTLRSINRQIANIRTHSKELSTVNSWFE